MMRRRKASKSLTNEEQRYMPKYSIGVVSKIIGLPPQMLRRYEEAGLLEPARQDGKNRLYSDENISVLEQIAELADQGINAAGIRHILKMRKQVLLLQQEVQNARVAQEPVQESKKEQN